MTTSPHLGHMSARGRIMAVLNCDEAMAEEVRQRLAALLDHRPTRAFIAKECHLATSTYSHIQRGRGKRVSDAVLINEGKRQVALFMVACAEAGLDLDLFSAPKEQSKG